MASTQPGTQPGTQSGHLLGGDQSASCGPDPLDRQMRDISWAVDTARRNPWFGGDLLAPEFSPVLAAIVAPRTGGYASGLEPGQAWRDHRNRWRDQLDRVG